MRASTANNGVLLNLHHGSFFSVELSSFNSSCCLGKIHEFPFPLSATQYTELLQINAVRFLGSVKYTILYWLSVLPSLHWCLFQVSFYFYVLGNKSDAIHCKTRLNCSLVLSSKLLKLIGLGNIELLPMIVFKHMLSFKLIALGFWSHH